MQPEPRRVPVEAGAPPNCQRNCPLQRLRRGYHSAPAMEQKDLEAIVRRALDEDLPDITSEAIFGPDERGTAQFVARATGIVAGLDVAETVFSTLEGTVELRR